MTHLLPWLTDHVRNAVEKCGAAGASVYVPTPWNVSAPGLLVHVGHGRPLPEMASLEAARSFSSATGARLGASEDPRTLTTVVVPSEVPEGCLLPVPLLSTLWNRDAGTPLAPQDGRDQFRRLSDRLGGPPIVGWLGLRFESTPVHEPLLTGWRPLLELASSLASTYVCFYGILTDPITGLPGRAELNGTLRAELDRSNTNGLPFSLVFLKLEQLDSINEQHGRRVGDGVLREFLELVHATLRRSDTVMRYGGSVFALPLRDVNPDGARVVGEKIQRRVAQFKFLNDSISLPCAVGVACCAGTEDPALRPLDMLRRADQALSASERDGGSRVVLWDAAGEVAHIAHLDPLLGVFTGQSEKDYRNMRLLWDVLQSMSSASGSDLARAVVARLFSLFSTTRVGLFERASDGSLRLAAGLKRAADSPVAVEWTAGEVSAEDWRINDEAVTSLEPQQRPAESMGARDLASRLAAFAIPLVIDGRALGTLFLVGNEEAIGIDATDFPVFGGVAAQLALALDRELLTEQQRAREHREKQVLRAELDRLRAVLKDSHFVYQSKPMADLLATTRRVASTDATVLITGESGTGKEMLAHTVHELSPRRGRPLVIVDCGAIPTSLIDSELFGRERGAYTGAERRAEGRLAQADGGTVFLDEIGELPLEVQAKLLRFVQEKTITMVGGTRAHKVDVRIIAATNRSLETEVAVGRFREDLFHRLNVVRLRVPPLRERPDDVTFLARHFLDVFARQYAKPMTGFEPEAERSLEAHDWSGNVRELQNTILQAVVLAEGSVIRAADLQINGSGHKAQGRPAPVASRTGASVIGRMGRAGDESQLPPVAFETARQALADRLAAEISIALSSGAKSGPPLGKWLAHDLVLEAFLQSQRVAARAALCLRLPETTFSRRLRQAEVEMASTKVPESWVALRPYIADILRSTGRSSDNVLDHVDELLLGLIADRVPHVAQAASLLGVTVPTYRRRLADAVEAGTDSRDGHLAGLTVE